MVKKMYSFPITSPRQDGKWVPCDNGLCPDMAILLGKSKHDHQQVDSRHFREPYFQTNLVGIVLNRQLQGASY